MFGCRCRWFCTSPWLPDLLFHLIQWGLPISAGTSACWEVRSTCPAQERHSWRRLLDFHAKGQGWVVAERTWDWEWGTCGEFQLSHLLTGNWTSLLQSVYYNVDDNCNIHLFRQLWELRNYVRLFLLSEINQDTMKNYMRQRRQKICKLKRIPQMLMTAGLLI